MLPHLVTEKDMKDGGQEATNQGSLVYFTVQGTQRDIWINDAYLLDGDHVVENGATFLNLFAAFARIFFCKFSKPESGCLHAVDKVLFFDTHRFPQ
jgi:hypothetical protein